MPFLWETAEQGQAEIALHFARSVLHYDIEHNALFREEKRRENGGNRERTMRANKSTNGQEMRLLIWLSSLHCSGGQSSGRVSHTSLARVGCDHQVTDEDFPF